MDGDDKLIEALAGISQKVLDTDGTDKDLIVEVGARLEAALGFVPSQADKLQRVLARSLEALQAVYQEAVSDLHAVMQAVGGALRAAEASLESGADAPKLLVHAYGVLQMVLGVSGGDASEAEPPPAPEPASAPESAPAGLDDIAARLVGLCPEDSDEIRTVRQQLSQCAGAGALSEQARRCVAAAGDRLEELIDGAEDAQGALASAVEQVTEAQRLQADAEFAADMDSPPSQEEPAPEAPPETPETPEAPEEAQTPPAPTPAPARQKVMASPAPVVFDAPAVLPDDAESDLLKEFCLECLDHISAAEAALLALESDPEDAEGINRIFRAFHTIKGSSGFLGLDRIQKCAHLAESQLDRAREGEIKIVGGYADLALKSCDALRYMIEGLEGLEPGDPLPLPNGFDDLLTTLIDPEAAGMDEDPETEQMRLGEILAGRGVDREAIEDAAEQQGDRPLGQALVEDKVVSPREVAKALRTQKQIRSGTGQSEGTIRVGTGRLDSLINMVGELVIAHSMVGQDPQVIENTASRLARNVSHAGKIIRELQDLTMALRMVPLKGTFQKMARLVRDVGRKAGKNIRFVTEGEETEIDRNLVEVLNDPLVHMMRNACDHGIESPQARQAAGKDPVGTVTLRAYHAAGNVVIELKDDGKGLDRERILAKAVERGLIEAGKELSDSEVFGLIWQPGFSTAEKVTDVSGRGVGMDVVRRNIQGVRGRIDTASRMGKGSTFTIRLPLTMAITDAMLVRVGAERYLLPTVSIEQSFQPEPGTISTVAGRGEVARLRGELIPVFRLYELFGVRDAVKDVYEGLLIVIESQGASCAVMVDELLGQQQVVIKTLGGMLGRLQGVAGGAILGDGRVGLILDAAGILSLAQGDEEQDSVAA